MLVFKISDKQIKIIIKFDTLETKNCPIPHKFLALKNEFKVFAATNPMPKYTLNIQGKLILKRYVLLFTL